MEDTKKKLPEVPADPAIGDGQKAVQDAVTSDAAAATTAEEAAKAVSQSLDGVDRINDQVGDNLDADAQNAQKGAPGVQKKGLFPRIGGVRKTAKVSSLMLKSRELNENSPVADRDFTVVSDMDKFERNERAASGAYPNIASDITFEATQTIEEGDTAIIGTPQQNSVYSMETTIVEETLGNDTTKYPIEHPRHRQIGTLFRRSSKMLSPTGDYVAGAHDTDKSWHAGHRVFRLNFLSENGVVRPNQFVEPKIGKFWVRGVNPQPFKDTVDGAPRRNLTAKVVEKNAHFDKTGQLIEGGITVKQHVLGTPGMFDVVDLTPYLNNIQTAQEQVIKDATCAKGKMRFGLFEALETQFNISAQSLNEDPEAANLWPDFNSEINRSTLWSGDRSSISGETAKCLNEPKKFFEFMEAVRNSEIMWMYPAISMMHGTDPILWGKGQTGLYKDDPYYYSYSGFAIEQDSIGHSTKGSTKPGSLGDKDIKGPNVVPFARYLTSANAFRKPGQWIYTFKEFHAKVNAYYTILKEDVSLSKVLKSAHMLKSACDELQKVLATGRITSDEGMTSNAIIKLPGVCDMLLDFDPNDLVEVTASGKHFYPCAGYTNIWTSTNQLTGSYKTYYICPTWLDSILQFSHTWEYRSLLTNDLSSTPHNPGDETSRKIPGTSKKTTAINNLAAWLQGGTDDEDSLKTDASRRYIPIQMDSWLGQLFPYFLMEAYAVCGDQVFAGNYRNAYLSRYIPACAKLGFDDIITSFWGLDVYSAIQTVINNPALKVDPKWQRPDQYPILYKEALVDFTYAHRNVIAQAQFGGKAGTGDIKRGAMIFAPDSFDEYIMDLEGLEAYKYTAITGDNISGYGDVIEIADDARQNVQAVEDVYNLTPDGSAKDSDAYLKDVANDVDVSFDVGYRYKIGRADGSISDYTKRLKVPQFDADTDFIGYTNTPEDALYKRDNFFVPNSDALIMGHVKGRYADASNAGTEEGRDNYFITEMDYTVFENEGAFSFETILPADTGEVYQGEGTTVDVSANSNVQAFKRGYSFKKGQENISSIIVSSAGRKLLRPSLYGVIRDVEAGATYVTRDWTGRCIDVITSRVTVDKNQIASVKKTQVAPNQDMMFGFLPHIRNLTANGANDWSWSSLAMLPIAGIDVTDYRYYYQQELFAGGLMEDVVDANYLVGDNGRYDIRFFFDIGNWIIASDIFDANIAKDKCSLRRFAQITFDDQIAYLINSRNTHLLFRRGKVSTTDGKSVIPTIFEVPHVSDHAKLLSRNTFNDLRVFKVGKPIRFLNRTSNYLNVFVNKFVDQYFPEV